MQEVEESSAFKLTETWDSMPHAQLFPMASVTMAIRRLQALEFLD